MAVVRENDRDVEVGEKIEKIRGRGSGSVEETDRERKKRDRTIGGMYTKRESVCV